MNGLSGLVREKVVGRLASLDQVADSKKEKPQPSANRPAPSKPQIKTTSYTLNDEKTIRKDWDLHGGWRLEGAGLRLLNGGGITSKDRFQGDFTIDVLLSRPKSTYEARVVFSLFGENLEHGFKNTEGIRIQRQGGQLAIARTGRQPQIVTIKEQQRSVPTKLGISLHWDYEVGGVCILQAIGYAGPQPPQR
jgi:hypothetical protein